MCHDPPTFLFNARMGKRWAAVLILAVAAAFLMDGALATMVTRVFAGPCPQDAPAASCVATLPARVGGTWDDYADRERLLMLDIPQAPPDTPRNPFDGTVKAWLSFADADRLNIDFDTDVNQVTATLVGGVVIEVTTPDGETAQPHHTVRPALAALEIAGWVLVLTVLLKVATRLKVREHNRLLNRWHS
jgi:hypothetical protein